MDIQIKDKEDKPMEIEVDGTKFTFRNDMTGWDFLDACNSAIREGMKAQARMAANNSINPKMTMQDIFNMPVGKCQKFLNNFAKGCGLDSDFLD